MVMWLLTQFFMVSWAGELLIQVQHQRLQVGQSTTLTVEAIDLPLDKAPAIPVGSGLFIQLENPNPSKEFQMINLKSRRIIKYQYSLAALKEGRWFVGPVSRSIGNRSYVAKSVTIDVISKGTNKKEQISVDASLSHEAPYAGELLLYHFRYKNSRKVLGQSWKGPQFQGFRQFSSLDIDQQNRRKNEQGMVVDLIDLRIPLLAVSPGAYSVSPAAMVVKIPIQGGRKDGLFGRSPFFQYSESESKRYITKKLEGIIRPLPEAPPDFSGLVGSFVLEVEVDKKEVSVGDSITFRMQMEGNGSLAGYRFPSISQPQFQIYADVPDYSVQYKKGGIQSTLKQNLAIVPIEKGKLEIKPISIHIFDPKKEVYQLLRSESINLTVKEGNQNAQLGLQSFADREGAVPIDEIMPPVVGPVTHHQKGLWLWGLLLFPLLSLGYIRGKGDQKKTKNKLSFPSPLPNNPQQRLSSLSNFFMQCIADKRKKTVAALSQEDFVACGEVAVVILNQLEEARFGGKESPDLESLIKEFWSKG